MVPVVRIIPLWSRHEQIVLGSILNQTRRSFAILTSRFADASLERKMQHAPLEYFLNSLHCQFRIERSSSCLLEVEFIQDLKAIELLPSFH